MIGTRFGNLTVVEKSSPGKFPGLYWICVCDCGTRTKVRGTVLRAGKTKSCGCSRKDFSDEPIRRQIYSDYKARSKKSNREFELSFEQFDALTKASCFYCGTHDTAVRKKRNSCYSGNGVDRKDNTKGYTVENSVACCRLCNHMKFKMTPDEFIAACRSVVDHFSKK